jgi:hypothetical protein
MDNKVIFGHKGFDKDLKCRGFQFEVGKEYEEPEAVICKKGFHFCENPLHIFAYYPPTSRFAEVEGSGKTAKHNEDSKVSCTKIKIGTEIGLKGIIEAGMKFVFSRVKWGEKDKPQTNGDYSAAQTHGDYSAAQTHGYYSAAQTHGNESISVSTGIKGKAAGIIGNWIVVVEWAQDDNYVWHIKNVKSVKIDGKKIKADTFYQLKNGEFVEVK